MRRVRAPDFGRIVEVLRRAVGEREAGVDRQHAARVVAVDARAPSRCRRPACCTTVSMAWSKCGFSRNHSRKNQSSRLPLTSSIVLKKSAGVGMLERPAARVLAERVVERLRVRGSRRAAAPRPTAVFTYAFSPRSCGLMRSGLISSGSSALCCMYCSTCSRSLRDARVVRRPSPG